MLVFSKKTQHHNRVGAWDPINKYLKRAGEDVKTFLEIIAEINLSLPDDWRMTRSTNNFSVLVVPTPGVPFVLKGYSYRYSGDNILHIIDSIFKPFFFDKDDLTAVGLPENSRVDRTLIRENPNLVAPNLYFFQPCPDDSRSALFARQYEKEKRNESNSALTETQYHRIHPLHKWGLDMDHYKWIKWKTDGSVEFIEYPKADYHGKDYWLIPALSKEQQRGNEEGYISLLKNLMDEYNVSPPVPPEQTQSRFEQEFKLLVPEDAGDPHQVFKKAITLLKEYVGLDGVENIVTRAQADYYFDDNNFHLYNNGASFRFRETKGSARVTLKARPHTTNPQTTVKGEYRRIEEESTISISQKKALFRGEQITALPYRLLPYVAPDFGKLKHVVSVHTKRELMEVRNKCMQKAEICFDITHYEINGKTYGPDVEIEIESKGLPRRDIKGIAELLESELKLKPSPYSKYERAVRYLKK